MRQARLNRRLALQEAVPRSDGAGGLIRDWADVAILWAGLSALSGQERLSEETSLARTVWRITVRAAPAGSPLRPRPDQRFMEGVRVFAILAVAEADPDGRYLTCFCREEGPR